MGSKKKFLFGLLGLSFIFLNTVFSQHLSAFADTFYTISGHVSDRAGNPVANAYYEFIAQSGTQNPVLVGTDANGNYSANVVPDHYRLTFGENHNPPSGFPPLAPSSNGYIDATAGNVTQDLQYDTVALNVNFVDQNGSTIPQAAVSATPQGGSTTFLIGRPDMPYTSPFSGSFGLNNTTDTNGVANFTVLRGLSYNICAVDPTTRVNACVTYAPTTDTSTVTLTAPAHYTISGHITDRDGNPAPFAHYVFRGQGVNSTVYTSIVTDASGNYSVNVLPNKYVLTNDPDNNAYLDTALGAPGDYYIDATNGNVVQDFQYDTVALNVHFVDQNGSSIPQASVSVAATSGGATTFPVGLPNKLYHFSGGNATQKTADSNGSATFVALRGLNYRACAVDPTTQVNTCIVYTPTTDTSTVTLTAPIHYNISGHISDRAGNPAADAHYVLRGQGANSTVYTYVVTDTNGDYSVNVIPNKYFLTADPDHNPYNSYGIFASGNFYLDATNGNITQDFQYDTVALNVHFVDQNGNSIPNASVSETARNGGATTFPVGLSNELYHNGFSLPVNGTTNASGTVSFTVLRGLNYSVCAIDPITQVDHCGQITVTTEGTNNVVIREGNPATPSNLSATSPTEQSPSLSWSSVDDTDHYDVYRDGSKLASTPTASYTDSSASEGSHTYYVQAVYITGAASSASNTVTVVYDKTAPTITASVDNQPNASGWNNGAVTITFNCSDTLSGVASCTSPVTVTTQGANQVVTGTAVDNAGNVSTTTAIVSIDTTKPTIVATQTPAANANGWNDTNVVVSFTCSDSLSGISSCSSPVTLSAELTNQSATGTAVDNAGNTNSVTLAGIKIDKTAPTASNASINPTPVHSNKNDVETISASASDNLSGVVGGEYYIDTDPGVGSGTTMTYSNGQLNATAISSTFSKGNHVLYIRSKDAAGNWSTTTSTIFKVS